MPPINVPQRDEKPDSSATDNTTRVKVSQFDFVGNTVLSTETLRQALAPWSQRELNYGELIEAVEAVEAAYKAAGYFLAQANLPPQQIKDGVIQITVGEGTLHQVRLEGESNIGSDTLYTFTDQLALGKPLQLPVLERQILLINELAGGRASLDLQAGQTEGSTDVVLNLTVESQLTGRLEANNHGAPSTGENRVGLTVFGNSLFNRGERVTLNVLNSDTNGLQAYTLRGDIPLGGDGWRASVTSSRATYALGGSFASQRLNGVADSQRLGLSYPIIRSNSKSLRVQLEADQTALNDNYLAVGRFPAKNSRGQTLTTSAEWIDSWGGGGANRLDLALRSGQLILNAAATADDGYNTRGEFSKLVLNATRQQNLGKEVSMQVALNAQEAGKNLDSSEKLSLGGPLTLPGYGNGEAVADSGYWLRLGTRWQVQSSLTLSAMTNWAQLRLAKQALANASVNNTRELADFALGADWVLLKNLNASALVAWPLLKANVIEDNNKVRLWLSLTTVF
jgi:hemolysin activation/secretion protein